MRAKDIKLESESGMASFLIVMILMLVITLIVIGFAQVTRRNSREALDRQLSSQAFYAAESGVNVTTNAIINRINTNGLGSLPTKTACGGDYDATKTDGVGAAITSLGGGVKYSCVLVNPNPDSLKYNPTQTSSTIIPIQANGNLSSLTFSWNMKSGGTDNVCTGSTQTFPTLSAWNCDFGILRVDLVSNPNANMANLAGNTVSLFMTPMGSPSGSVTVSSFTSPRAYRVTASDCLLGTCKVTVNLPSNSSSYYARVTSLYQDTPNMTLKGMVGGVAATFSGAQAVVDSTGQAQDQLRRIQVRVALVSAADGTTVPRSAIGSGDDVCKHFSIKSSEDVDPLNLCQ